MNVQLYRLEYKRIFIYKLLFTIDDWRLSMTRATESPMQTPLTGRVAVVAGATRGAGRGIARALGEAGATVYCTGRSVAGQPSPYRQPETIDETAASIVAGGGAATAVRVDHTVEAEVRALFERIEEEHGRLDVLVNSIAGEDPILGGWDPLWKVKLDNAEAMMRQAVLSHVITAKHAAALMLKAASRPPDARSMTDTTGTTGERPSKRHGLIVEVTENDILMSGGHVLTQLVKTSLKVLATIYATDLRPHGIAAISITPGFLRSERMLERFGVTESNWRDGAKKDKNFLESESPIFVGRAVVALATDPDVMKRSGHLFSSWELGREYGFTDADGRRPDWGMSDLDFSVVPKSIRTMMRHSLELQRDWLKVLSARTDSYITKWSDGLKGA
jgi:NAD(P)-dependent dehydrogenase (short-subunit alcohol dehydrogenase family)